MASLDSFKCRKTLSVGAKTYEIYSLKAAEKNGLAGVSRLPFSLKIVLENLLRNEDGRTVKKQDIEAVAAWIGNRGKKEHEIAFRPARVLMQDFTGVPAVVDLAAMRDAMVALGGDPNKINPLVPVDLVIDHSVVVDHFGTRPRSARTSRANTSRTRSATGSSNGASRRSRISASCRPAPASAIRSISNISRRPCGRRKRSATARRVEVAFPDTLVGTDSHTTMVNGLAVLGWGVGGIEAEAAMLGQPLSMLLPEVIGFRLDGELREGVTATDLVLTVTQMLRKKGVVGKFVEFYGPGLNAMTVADRATLANMAPEYGATCGLFPIDAQTLALSEDHGPQAFADRPGRGLRESAGRLPHPLDPRSRLFRYARAQPRRGHRLARRPEAAAGPRGSDRGQGWLRRRHGKRIPAGRHDRRAPQGRGDELRSRTRRRRHRRHHFLHQHLQSERDDGRRACGAQRGRQGPDRQAVGQDLARAGQPGGRGLSEGSRPAEAARQARLQHRRLRLHHLHRQFRPARARDFGDNRQAQSGRGGGPLRQPQFRGPRQPGRARELPRFSAAGGGLRPGRLDAGRSHPRPARRRQTGKGGLSRRHLAEDGRDPGLCRGHHHRENVQDQIRERVRRRRQLAQGESARGPDLRLGHGLDLCAATRPISRG